MNPTTIDRFNGLIYREQLEHAVAGLSPICIKDE